MWQGGVCNSNHKSDQSYIPKPLLPIVTDNKKGEKSYIFPLIF